MQRTLEQTKVTEQFPIVVNEATREVSVGKWIADGVYYNGLMKESAMYLKLEILEANGIEISADYCPKIGQKNIHTEIIQYLGPVFYRRLRYVMMRVWIDPDKALLDKYCFYSNGFTHRYCTAQMQRLWKHRALAEQVEKDEQYAIMPLVVYFGASPKTLKKSLGKGLWKHLCSKSLSYNRELVKHLQTSIKDLDRINSVEDFEQYIAIIGPLSQLKVTLMKMLETDTLCNYSPNKPNEMAALLWVNQYAKVSDKESVESKESFYRDTERMAIRQGFDFNPLWSLKKMTQRHDKYTQMALNQEYTRKPFSWLADLKQRLMLVEEGVTISVPGSPYEMAQESSEMHHCVVSYIENVAAKKYLVFSLKNEAAGSRSTLSFKLYDNLWIEDQHYGVSNSQVTCDKLLSVVKSLEDTLNSKELMSQAA